MDFSEQNNKRVFKNTMLLYVRMIILLGVSLFTTRIVLAALGFDDYGIYNVVGGVVALFSFLNTALSNSTSRFITYALGKGDKQYSQSVFNSSLLVHVGIALLVLILAETVGLWFLHNKMVIPESRQYAASWVYQFSIISGIATILYAPFNAVIIAHERMGAFAKISIVDAFLKLLIAYIISIYHADRLILYSGLYLGVNLCNIIIYVVYCRINFNEVKYRKITDKGTPKEIMGFASWSIIGNLAHIGYTQGLNILLNIFFGPLVNAARGISTQLQGAIMGFVTNFQMAVNPQIIKSYANEDYNRLHSLIYMSSKFSFFLLFCIILPLSIEARTVLQLWLGEVPEYTVKFTILTLFARLIDTLSNPIGIANNATGSIKVYQIIEGGTLLLIVPVSYILLKRGNGPISVFWVQLIIMYAVQVVRLFLVCHKIEMSIITYCNRILVKILPVAVCSPILPCALRYFMSENLLSSIIIIMVSVFSVIIFSYLIGLEKEERQFINTKIMTIVCRIKTHS